MLPAYEEFTSPTPHLPDRERGHGPERLQRLPGAQCDRHLPPKTLPRVIGSPVAEVIGAIQGKIEAPGSNFDYAVPLTEIVLLGTIANRAGKVVEYQPQDMTFKDPTLNPYIKEAVRPGWEYGG